MTGQASGPGLAPASVRFSSAMERLSAAREVARQRRNDILRERGWTEAIQCLSCGDTGVEWRPEWTGPGPDPSAPLCWCEAGDAIRTREAWEARWRQLVPRRLVHYRLDTSPQIGVAAEVARWIASGPWRTGENALLFGPVGTGKTGLAIGAMRAAHDQRIETRLIIVSDWLIQQRAMGDAGDDDPMESASRPDLLVIDDLGTQKNSEWVHERLYVLINRRYLDRKSTLVTTNHHDLDRLRESLGDRATSRLLEQCQLFGVEGEDLRTVRTGGRS